MDETWWGSLIKPPFHPHSVLDPSTFQIFVPTVVVFAVVFVFVIVVFVIDVVFVTVVFVIVAVFVVFVAAIEFVMFLLSLLYLLLNSAKKVETCHNAIGQVTSVRHSTIF